MFRNRPYANGHYRAWAAARHPLPTLCLGAVVARRACRLRHHEVLSAEAWSDDIPALVCMSCGIVGAGARRNLKE